MKAVAYSIRAIEKEPLVKANGKRHDITLISNTLNAATLAYAEGKEAILVSPFDDLSAPMLSGLQEMGVRLVVTRSQTHDHIDMAYAEKQGMSVVRIEEYHPESVAEQALALMLALSRNLIPTHRQLMHQEFPVPEMIGTTISEKTIGIIGFGQTGQALAKLLSGFNPRLLVHDILDMRSECATFNARQVSLDELLGRSDIISIHLPLNPATRHFIDIERISRMKTGVMLINVSRGEILHSVDVYHALQNELIHKVGMDVYEFEKDILKQDQPFGDKLLRSFIQNSRVLLTPHQSLLTKEGLQMIAARSIQALDQWVEENKVLVRK